MALADQQHAEALREGADLVGDCAAEQDDGADAAQVDGDLVFNVEHGAEFDQAEDGAAQFVVIGAFEADLNEGDFAVGEEDDVALVAGGEPALGDGHGVGRRGDALGVGGGPFFEPAVVGALFAARAGLGGRQAEAVDAGLHPVVVGDGGERLGVGIVEQVDQARGVGPGFVDACLHLRGEVGQIVEFGFDAGGGGFGVGGLALAGGFAEEAEEGPLLIEQSITLPVNWFGHRTPPTHRLVGGGRRWIRQGRSFGRTTFGGGRWGRARR